jgi:hypothetical protein
MERSTHPSLCGTTMKVQHPRIVIMVDQDVVGLCVTPNVVMAVKLPHSPLNL